MPRAEELSLRPRDAATAARTGVQLVVLLLASGCATSTVSIRPVRIEVLEKTDSNERDEPYFGVISFVSTFGGPGSTRVVRHDRLRPTPRRVEEGSTADIPDRDDIGRAIRVEGPRTAADVGAGVSLVGQIILALDSDDAGWDPVGARGVKAHLNDLRDCLEQSLRERVEETDPAAGAEFLFILRDIAQDLCGVIPAREEGVRETPLCFELHPGGGGGALLEGLLTPFRELIESFVNPDDPMGVVFVVTAVVEEDEFTILAPLCVPPLPPDAPPAVSGPCPEDRFQLPTEDLPSRASVLCTFSAAPRELTFDLLRLNNRRGHWQVTVRVEGRRSLPNALSRVIRALAERE